MLSLSLLGQGLDVNVPFRAEHSQSHSRIILTHCVSVLMTAQALSTKVESNTEPVSVPGPALGPLLWDSSH